MGISIILFLAPRLFEQYTHMDLIRYRLNKPLFLSLFFVIGMVIFNAIYILRDTSFATSKVVNCDK